jgi:hypothetical protein
VGILADLREGDEEGHQLWKAEFSGLNRYLASVGLPVHEEPVDCLSWSHDMYGYSGLHYLRRLAAHLDLKGRMPDPGDETAPNDETLSEYYWLAAGKRRGVLGWFGVRPQPKIRTFDHLIVHSDSEGYYLPMDFKDVLRPDDSFPVPGGMVGSSFRLLDECGRLSQSLQIPQGLSVDTAEAWMAEEGQGRGIEAWRRYAIETFSCLCLIQACEYSIRTGAALVFT